MQSAIRRTRFRVLIAFAVVAVPLLAAGSAHAAMAGANPATTTLRPDLRSAVIASVNTTNGETVIQVCFDKQLDTVSSNNFAVGTYAQQTTLPDSVTNDAANNQCVNAITRPRSSIRSSARISA